MASADVVRDKLQTYLIVPNATRWNSSYNSVVNIRDLLGKTPDDVTIQVFHALDVTPLSVNQVNFIKVLLCYAATRMCT